MYLNYEDPSFEVHKSSVPTTRSISLLCIDDQPDKYYLYIPILGDELVQNVAWNHVKLFHIAMVQGLASCLVGFYAQNLNVKNEDLYALYRQAWYIH